MATVVKSERIYDSFARALIIRYVDVRVETLQIVLVGLTIALNVVR